MLAICNAHEHGAFLALRTRAHDCNFIARIVVNLFRFDDRAFLDFHVSQLLRDRDVRFHRKPFDRDFAALSFARENDLLDAPDHRRERADDDPAFRTRDDFVDIFLDFILGELTARLRRVRRVDQKREHIAFAEMLNFFRFLHGFRVRRGVELEVTRVHDNAARGIHDHAHRRGDRMRDAEEFHAKDAELDHIIGFDDVDVDRWFVAMVFLPFLNNSSREIGREERRIAEARHKVGNAADVVVVRVSDDHAANIFFLAFEARDVWDDVIHARHVFIRKLESHVYEDDVAAIF